MKAGLVVSEGILCFAPVPVPVFGQIHRVIGVDDADQSTRHMKSPRRYRAGALYSQPGRDPDDFCEIAYTPLVRKTQSRFRPYQSSRTTVRVLTGSFIAARRRASRAIGSDTPSISNMIRPGLTLQAQ